MSGNGSAGTLRQVKEGHTDVLKPHGLETLAVEDGKETPAMGRRLCCSSSPTSCLYNKDHEKHLVVPSAGKQSSALPSQHLQRQLLELTASSHWTEGQVSGMVES